MDRYICIHAHLYQPPRENPWLEAVEVQDSAYPYHDWNERVTGECYAPNAFSRILDGDGRIVDIVNNYSRISFNFGPTLLAWLERHSDATYQAILEADRESRGRFGGHGSALAQAYNHLILPLANARDQETQVVWGLRDFERRFGRAPEGMWLPETAADLATLEVLARHGLRFAILAPRQAAAVRRLSGGGWHDVGGERVDPSTGYRQTLPSGRELTLFFYDGPISRAVAFEGLLQAGERLADRLEGAFAEHRPWPQLVHIATDGESYGHHHRHGDMALAWALSCIESRGQAELINYGEYLERCAPTHAVRIAEGTSWSCEHGLERWRSDCGCRAGDRWHQRWRGPLREALDWLRDTLAPRYEAAAAPLLHDPWGARDAYIDVILDRSRATLDRFFAEQATRSLTDAERTTALKLLELQRHALLMYTSCGWFFDELSGLETVQVLQYAGRVVQLARELFPEPVEEPFLERLARAPSNLPQHGDGRRIYEKWVRPTTLDLTRVGAHYAVASVFGHDEERSQIYCYAVDRHDHRVLAMGPARLAIGRVTISSDITLEAAEQTFAVLHFGDHNVSGGVRPFRGEEAYAALVAELSDAFGRADLPETLRLVDRHLDGVTHSLASLFRDQQRQVVEALLGETTSQVERVLHEVYDRHAPLMRFLATLEMPVPKVLRGTAELVLNSELRRAIAEPALDLERVSGLLETARLEETVLDTEGLAFAFSEALARLGEELHARAWDTALLEHVAAVAELSAQFPFEVDLWRTQNVCHALARGGVTAAPGTPPPPAPWAAAFARLAQALRVKID